ncbi:MAG: glycosyltransferase [Oceanospirillaceae bacterium]|nr:glycosyltransferase [Oceanospirillaceae bacterium]
MSVSVIIPIGPGEPDVPPLLGRLHMLPACWQVIVALCPESKHLATLVKQSCSAEVVVASRGRAQQMNAAVKVATGEYLWFLHLDSVLTEEGVAALREALLSRPRALLYYQLIFAQDGRGPIWLNAFSANLRSRWLGVPFGDQAFCLPRSTFLKVGGYREDLPYGEDHVLVWRLRLAGVSLQMLPCKLETSARKYRAKGWLRLTLLYQWYWLRQAAPYACRLLRKKFLG